MANELLIRDIPPEIREWIADVSAQRRQTRKEVVLNVLRQAYTGSSQLSLFGDTPRVIKTEPDAVPFTFVDLFAGIGGLRLALEPAGGRSVFACEWDRYSQKTYREWFGETPAGDITQLKPAEIPDHDILAAGFPCQPFSIAGVSKKKSLGRAHGFKDVAQGTLFFHLATSIGGVDRIDAPHRGLRCAA